MKEMSSRTRFLFQQLEGLGHEQAIEALHWMIDEFSAEKGFARKGSGVDYYYHLVDTTQFLLNFGVRDEKTLLVAILHDSIEDLDSVSERLIADKYGEEVAKSVSLVTKEDGVDYKCDTFAMKKYLEDILEDESATLVKSADRLHNSITLLMTSKTHRERQLEETKEFFIPFFKRARKKYPEHTAFFFQCKTTIEPILYEIERTVGQENTIAKLEKRISALKSRLHSKKG